MGWIYLSLAIFFEITWATSLKLTEGYTRIWPVAFNLLLALGGIFSFSRTLQVIPTSLAYPTWVGISTVGITMIGCLYFQEMFSFYKLFFITLIVLGIVGLKIVGE